MSERASVRNHEIKPSSIPAPLPFPSLHYVLHSFVHIIHFFAAALRPRERRHI